VTQILEPSPAGATAAAESPARSRSRVPALPLLVLGCFVLAALSLTLPSVPTQDSWSWIVWGREVAHFDLSTTGGSSWKPLPVLFTTIYSVAGDTVAPKLWIMTSRAGGLLAILFAFRIAKRYGGWPAGIAAAVFMAGADWFRFMGNGNVEPLSAGLALGAVDRHLDEHPHQAIALGALAALGRPELWPFVALYAGFMVFKRKKASLVIAAVLLVLVPVGWLGGDWWGSGDPFHGSKLAAGFRERTKQHREAALLRDKKRHIVVDRSTGVAVEHTLRGARVLLIPPAFVAALIAIGFAVYRRERTPLVLAGGAIALFAVIGGMALAGYGGSPRFLFPAAGLVAVLGGIGIGELVRVAGERWRPAAFLAAAALTAIIVPFAIDRGNEFSARAHEVRLRAVYEDQLDKAVQLAGGRQRVLSLGEVRANSTYAHQLAWLLHIHQNQIVGPKPRNVVFSGRPTAVSPSRPPRLPSHDVKVTRVAGTGIWTVLQVQKTPKGP
jgi:hypothetical protein